MTRVVTVPVATRPARPMCAMGTSGRTAVLFSFYSVPKILGVFATNKEDLHYSLLPAFRFRTGM